MKNRILAICALSVLCLVAISLMVFTITSGKSRTESSPSVVKKLLEQSLAKNEATSSGRQPASALHSRSAEGPKAKSKYSPTTGKPGAGFLSSIEVPEIAASDSSITAGSYEKDAPSFEWLDPDTSIENILAFANSTNTDFVYGWLQLQSGFSRNELSDNLEQHQTIIFGMTGLYARVRLPASRATLKNLADESDIAGLGMQPIDKKTSEEFDRLLEIYGSAPELPVFISVMQNEDSDSTRKSLADLGVTVGQWFGEVRSYSANIPTPVLGDVLGLDFVEEVSPNGIVTMLLDSANPSIGIDSLREYQQSTGSFEGATGSGVAIGVLDTGLNVDHLDFSSKDVCGANFLSNTTFDERDLFNDAGGHGSHVTGILSGEGRSNRNYVGVAPGVSQIRIGKVLDEFGSGTFLDVFNAVSFMFEDNPCEDETSNTVPSIVNVSLGGFSSNSNGKALFNRKLDATIYEHDQAYVIAAGNSGSSGISNIGSTKNAIVAAAIYDNGIVTDFSSHGPTADGRLSPHIAAPGSLVTAVEGDGSRFGYVQYSGTSMATPMIAGLAAVKLESNDWNPALLRAVLMAEAIKPDAIIGHSYGIPTDNTNGPGVYQAEYGMGIVSATSDWAAGDEYSRDLTSSAEFSQTIDIPEGVSRLDIVLTWIEPPATSFSDTVIANLDLYLDENSDCGSGACGEYSSRSPIDNNEWLLLKNPEPGSYTIKVVAANDFTSPAKIGVAWRAIGKSMPQLSLEASTARVAIDHNDSLEIDLTISVDEFLAAGTTVHMACEGDYLSCSNYENDSTWHRVSHAEHADGTLQELMQQPMSVPLAVGEVSAQQSRRVQLKIPRGIVDETHTLYFVASSFNAAASYVAVEIVVANDQELPAEVTPPDNDQMENSLALSGTSGDFDVDLLLASRQPGEHMVRGDESGSTIKKFFNESFDSYSLEAYSGYSRYSSVWYEVTTQEDSVLLSMLDVPLATSVAVFEATEEESVLIFSYLGDLDASSDFSLRIKPSQKYLVQIYSQAFSPVSGSIRWTLGEDVPPTNDDFQNAEQIEGSSGSVAGSNFNSSLEAFEFYGSRDSESTWFKWTAPESRTFRFDASPARVLVFSGTDNTNLLRMSSLPASTSSNYLRAEANEQYYIAVVSSADDGSINDYELSWNSSSDSSLADNDQFGAAYEISGSSGEVSDYISSTPRTREGGEPKETGVGTLWWRWTPSESGYYTFSLQNVYVEHLSIFSGETLSNLTLLASGTEVSVSADADQAYYIAYGVSVRFSFNDMEGEYSPEAAFAWGASPENDLRSEALALTGSSGSVTFSHEYATLSVDDPRRMVGTHSLWWSWTAPSSGWFKFVLDAEDEVPILERQVDNILAVLRSGSNTDVLATSDRSYVLNGKPEVLFYATSGNDYEIQVLLRSDSSTEPFAESSFTWDTAEAPQWLRFQEQLVDSARPGMDNEVESLLAPRSITIDASSNTLYVAAETGFVVLSLDPDTGSVAFSKDIEHVNESRETVASLGEAVLAWDTTSSNLYAMNDDALYIVRELSSDSPYLEQCLAFEDPFLLSAEQLIIDSQSQFFYAVGDDIGLEIDIYKKDDICSFSAVSRVSREQVSDLRSGHAAVMGPNQNHFYVTTDSGLVAFSRDSSTGELAYESIARTSDREDGFSYDWDYSTLAVANSGNRLFVVGHGAPYVGIYDIEADPKNPTLLTSVTKFHADPNNFDLYYFQTRESLPVAAFDCRLLSASQQSEAVDLICGGVLYSITYEEEELIVEDMLLEGESDRFDGDLSEVTYMGHGLTQGVVDSDDSRVFVIVDDHIDSLLVFERASNIDEDPY